MLLDLHVGKGIVRGGLTLFPVWNGGAVASRGYDLGTGTLQVSEHTEHAVVAELMVLNTGRRPALVLEGELLEGGQQHRVAARSLLVPAGVQQPLEVRCVEEGRWSGSRSHRRTLRRAPVSVRSADSQGGTWERVRRLEGRHGGGGSHFLGDALRNIDAEATGLVAGLAPLPFQSGVLVAVGGYPVQLEAYDSPRTLAGTWDALIHAAALDAVQAPSIATPGYRARRFVEQTRTLSADDDIAGRRIRHSPHVRLTCLTWRGRTVHAVALNPRHELISQ